MSAHALLLRRSKPVACHSRKVKCSGERPCSICRDAGLHEECVYPARDRQVKISQKSLEALIEENNRLRNSTATEEAISSAVSPNTANGDETLENPLFDERPWFHTVSSSHIPIHIGEAADAAFATRFRQTLATVCTTHLPRMSYLPDTPLTTSEASHYRWPSPARARFLVKVAFSTVCRYFHIVRRSVVQDSLETAINNNGNGERLTISKLLALFALGEVYSAKAAARETTFPGLAYFVQARSLVSEPMERPQLDSVEVTLLLAIYSLTLNRRHSAYLFASSAIKIGLIMGMQLNVPDNQNQDRPAREHRVRLWWTAYILDRTCTSKIGIPVSIADHDIQVNLPSDDEAECLDTEDFVELEYELRSIELARTTAFSTEQIYSRRVYHNTFSQRVQTVLKAFNEWMDKLPSRFHLRTQSSSLSQEPHIIHLHLRFNQGIILATRPILLHVLSIHRKAWTDNIDPKPLVPDTANTLVETCIQCARHSYQIVTDAWAYGSFATFDYFHTQYLFSAATVLAISSSLRSPQSEGDNYKFENAVELLRQLEGSGSFVAKEFCEHVDAMQSSIAAINRSYDSGQSAQRVEHISGSGAAGSIGTGLTAGMALAEPSFRDFLAETDLDTQGFDDFVFDDSHALYWPEI
ncbi:fungal specific transcription factor domain-containing protein [Stagonosporopsis vannaccii]|nr:fungal specific transcription factor domain-containing protein [Stagonosporopsis vannaccii]